MLKVLHVAGTYLPYIGGSSLRLRNLLEPIAQECELHVLVPRRDIFGNAIYENEILDFEIINGINVHRVPTVSLLRAATKHLCQTHQIDLIHAHNPRFAFIALLARTHRPLLLELRAPTELTRTKGAIAHWVYHHVDHLVVLSKTMKSYLMRKHHVSKEQITVIYNGVDIQKFQALNEQSAIARAKYGLDDYRVVGYVGSFYEWQGVINLVRAFSEVVRKRKNMQLLMVGDGPDRVKVQKTVQKLNLESQVTLTGSIPPEEVPAYLAAMDVFVIPRPSTVGTETAIPLKVLEAMAAGVPIVATEVGGLTEVLEHGVDALLCPPGRDDLIAERISLLLDNSELRNRLGRSAQEKVRRWYSWGRSAEHLLRLYDEVLSGAN